MLDILHIGTITTHPMHVPVKVSPAKAKSFTPPRQSPVLDDASAMHLTTNQTWHAQTASLYYGMTTGLNPHVVL